MKRLMTRQKQLGQGLVEVLIALLVILASMVAIIHFQSNLTYSDDVSRQQNYAIMMATDKMEDLRNFSTLTGTGSYDSIATGSQTVTEGSATFIMIWTVTASTSDKLVSVYVFWIDRRAQTQFVRITSRIGEIDPINSALVK